MFLFGRDMLKVRSEEDEDGIKTFVNYSRILDSQNFFIIKKPVDPHKMKGLLV